MRRARGRRIDVTEPKASARSAGLHYVTDTEPGVRRLRAGTGARYVRPDGRPLRDPGDLARIRALAIPPAWTDVWICPREDGHLQASGRDARGRKQYRYHARWRQVRDETKYTRMLLFAGALPRIRRRVARDLARTGLPREKVLATVVRLLETTMIRVGNEEYARENGSVGLTTMRNRHVDVSGATLSFEFRGKGGKQHRVDLTDRRLARIVRRCQELPGHELFQYLDAEGHRRAVDSADVNDYLRAHGGDEFTAKDFRTWAGTVLAARALQAVDGFSSPRQAKRNIARAIERVAKDLGNTPTVCRTCYVHPAVIDAYLAGVTLRSLAPRPEHGLRPEEGAVLDLLRQRLPHELTARRRAA
jgi:DNA topoisomerase-1